MISRWWFHLFLLILRFVLLHLPSEYCLVQLRCGGVPGIIMGFTGLLFSAIHSPIPPLLLNTRRVIHVPKASIRGQMHNHSAEQVIGAERAQSRKKTTICCSDSSFRVRFHLAPKKKDRHTRQGSSQCNRRGHSRRVP